MLYYTKVNSLHPKTDVIERDKFIRNIFVAAPDA